VESEDFHLGFRLIRGKGWRGTFDFYMNLLAWNNTRRILEAVTDSSVDIVDDAFELDELAMLAKVGASLVAGI
jgi:hypothetical protein